ncbi:TIGR00730 family Rossman fold protein [Oryzomicrobium sp.]|uniref:LOG family protein n=1 Tax=Oryzomicrobium sp. TaxID=1911578 RepID=UPI002FE3086A
MTTPLTHVCVYCGSNTGTRPEYAEAAQQLGRLLAERSLTLVYGGGNIGLMGIVADATLAAGGRVEGIIPQALVDKEVAHLGLTELVTVANMHERKLEMANRAGAFIALPGGIGTLEELFEVWTWLQLGFHAKPVALLNTAGYYDHLLKFIDHQVDERFLKPHQRDLLQVSADPAALLDRIASYQPEAGDKWYSRRNLA